jgi:hypothetical protein
MHLELAFMVYVECGRTSTINYFLSQKIICMDRFNWFYKKKLYKLVVGHVLNGMEHDRLSYSNMSLPREVRNWEYVVLNILCIITAYCFAEMTIYNFEYA